MVRPWVFTVLVWLACAGAWPSDPVVLNVSSTPETEADRSARETILIMEKRLAEIALLPVQERWARERELGGDLEGLASTVAGTRHENKAVYWLASWHLRHGDDPETTGRHLDRLAALRSPAFKELGMALRVRLLLQQGRAREALEQAQSLVAVVPEFAPVLRLVEFHQRIGRPAPNCPARNLATGINDPLRQRSEAWLLVSFVSLNEPEGRFELARMLAELKREAYRDRIRPVVVSMDSQALDALAAFRQLDGAEGIDLLWANPNPEGEGRVWEAEWRLPALPVTVLLGPDRAILGVDPALRKLRPLVGLEPDDDGNPQPRRGLNWRGRRW